MSVVRRILLARFGAMGDLLLSTPTIRALRRRFPEAEISYIVGKGLGDMLRGHPDLAEVIEFDKRSDARPASFVAFGRQLRARRFDVYVNLQRSVKTMLLGVACGAPRRLVYRRDHSLQAQDGRMLHSVDNFLRTVAPLGIDIAACDRHLDYAVPSTAQEKVAQLLHEKGIAAHDRLVLVNPGASAASRQWPVSNLAAMLDLLVSRRSDLRVALIGGRGADQQIARDTLSRMSQAHAVLDLVAAVDLKQTGALLQRADVMVSMDTGPMHMAAAVGTPLVALFGATSPDRTGPTPPPPGSRAVMPMALVHRDGLGCVPCQARACKRGDIACLSRQSPEAVLAAIERQLVSNGLSRH
jgi:ADP-heptose:LPS heptosyltransferase